MSITSNEPRSSHDEDVMAEAVADVPPAKKEADLDDPKVIRADIDETRAALGDTVEQIVGRMDMRKRAKEATSAGRAAVGDMAWLWVPALAGTVVATVGVIFALRKRT